MKCFTTYYKIIIVFLLRWILVQEGLPDNVTKSIHLISITKWFIFEIVVITIKCWVKQNLHQASQLSCSPNWNSSPEFATHHFNCVLFTELQYDHQAPSSKKQSPKNSPTIQNYQFRKHELVVLMWYV